MEQDMLAYQGRHLSRVEEAGHAAKEVEGDLLVMVALHAVREVLQPTTLMSKLRRASYALYAWH